MALPTAPLGQLGTMSMPYSIPTYDKGPNIWEKALAALLVNAAGGIAQQGTQNLMSRDYAKDFGEKPASVWGRLVGGPQVSAEQAQQRQREKFVTSERLGSEGFQRGENEYNRMVEAMQHEADAKNQLLQQDASIQGSLDARYLQDKNAMLREGEGNRDREALIRLQAQLAAENPENVAQARYWNANADNLNTKADFSRGLQGTLFGSKKGYPAPGGLHPDVVNDKPAATAPGTQSTGNTTLANAVPGATEWPVEPDFYTTRSELIQEGLAPEVVDMVLQKQAQVKARASGTYGSQLTTPAETVPSGDMTAFGQTSLPFEFLKSLLQPETINDRRLSKSRPPMGPVQ